ncbi:MAG: hypothetical protein GOV00_01905 [Candidatus Altiarchaeota archaeon]|nr:hypothetical protein [Candidatus Altiarchaeota archaeon]
MQALIAIEELKKLEAETGLKLKRLEKASLKWRVPPDWSEEKVDALLVEFPENRAAELFEKYKSKFLRK